MRLLFVFSICYCILLITYGCSCTQDNSSKAPIYSFYKLKNAWKEKDIDYMRFAIEALKDTTLSDCEYAFRAEELQNVTGFVFCWIDCGDDSWTMLPTSDQKIYRAIIGMAFEEYSNSCMFLQDVDWILCSDIDLYEYCDPDRFKESKDNLAYSIRQIIKEICLDCK